MIGQGLGQRLALRDHVRAYQARWRSNQYRRSRHDLGDEYRPRLGRGGHSGTQRRLSAGGEIAAKVSAEEAQMRLRKTSYDRLF